MTHVTDDLAQLLDTRTEASDYEVFNSGADAVEVSIDPDFEFGDGIAVAAGDRKLVHVPIGNRLFAICDTGEATDVSLITAQNAQSFGHIREDLDAGRILVDWVLKTSANVWATDADNTTETVIGPAFASFTRAAPDDLGFGVAVIGEDDWRARFDADGSVHRGDGTNPPDVSERRTDADSWQASEGAYHVKVAADGLYVASVDYDSADMETTDWTQVGLGSVVLRRNFAGVSKTGVVRIDEDGDLTFNNVKVQLQA